METKGKGDVVKEGDKNSLHFHKVASGQKRRNHIVSLKDNDQVLNSVKDIASKFYEFFLNLFDNVSKSVINLDYSLIFREEFMDLSDLTKEFTLDEIKHVVFILIIIKFQVWMYSTLFFAKGIGQL